MFFYTPISSIYQRWYDSPSHLAAPLGRVVSFEYPSVYFEVWFLTIHLFVKSIRAGLFFFKVINDIIKFFSIFSRETPGNFKCRLIANVKFFYNVQPYPFRIFIVCPIKFLPLTESVSVHRNPKDPIFLLWKTITLIWEKV